MTEEFATNIIRWWCRQEEGEYASYIAEDFSYDGGLEVVGREEFLLMRAGAGAMDDIKFINSSCGDSLDVVMFEATDTVTDLRHRTCWIISHDGDRIVRVAACSGVVLKPESRPA
jgi:hypothetical protein